VSRGAARAARVSSRDGEPFRVRPAALRWLGVDVSLRRDATAYAVIRGLAAPLALCQSVALSGLLAMRDAATPLKVVAAASLLNLVGDLLLCVWPWRFGPAGAAAATSLSTAFGAILMLGALRKRGLLSSDDTPWWRDYFLPPRKRRDEMSPKALKNELRPLATYAGPLSAIVLARLVGLAAMQRTAAAFGVAALAAYQVRTSRHRTSGHVPT
jgi:Na+-driven multidrug efflux pump